MPHCTPTENSCHWLGSYGWNVGPAATKYLIVQIEIDWSSTPSDTIVFAIWNGFIVANVTYHHLHSNNFNWIHKLFCIIIKTKLIWFEFVPTRHTVFFFFFSLFLSIKLQWKKLTIRKILKAEIVTIEINYEKILKFIYPAVLFMFFLSILCVIIASVRFFCKQRVVTKM